MKLNNISILLNVLFGIALIYMCYLLFFEDRNIVIKHGDIKIEKIEHVFSYSSFELPKFEVKAELVYSDQENNKHQKYSNEFSKKDSTFELYLKQTIDVNIEKKIANWFLDSLEVKTFETIKTKTDTLVQTKFKELPFYMNNWFWYFISETSVMILTFLIVWGLI